MRAILNAILPTFMTKNLHLSLLLLLGSCSAIDFSYFQSIRDAVSRNNIDITQSYVDSASFSFIKVSNSKNDAIFVLSSIDDNGVYKWIGSNYEIIKTLNGLIIETQGLESDIKLYPPYFKGFDSLDNYSTYMNLSNPELIYEEIKFVKRHIKVPLDRGNVQIFKIERSSPGIGWESSDRYVFKDGVIQEATQEINPFRDELKINFYFK